MFDNAAIAHIGKGIIAATLPKSEWTHAAHVAAAAHVVAARPDLVAEAAMPGLIRRYNEACGVANTDTAGYHHTITLASIASVRAGLALAPAGSLAAQVNWLLAGMLGDKYWPERFWQHDTLFSPAARRAWLAPDRGPLPFAVRP
ncbi:hypothetical protein [Sandarakinorhabdus sp.]|uniref:hypothetical protein n=1 Tax=Sandarakinorhabdus sp. TaxID=1916663 RepID=UPI00333FD620